jgi:hypothetical protein
VVNSATLMNVWYSTNEGQLDNIYWTPSTGWVEQTLPDAVVTGAPTGVARSPTAMDVFYTTGNGLIGNDSWTNTTGWSDQLLPAPAGAH